MTAFDSFGTMKPSLSIMFTFLFGLIFPELSTRLPSAHRDSLKSIKRSTRGTATELLDKAAKEKADDCASEVNKSILGALGKNSSFLANNGLIRLSNNLF